MTSIFTSISGHFGKALILGAFFPAAVFLIFWSIFIEPIYPAIQTQLSPLGLFSDEWPLLAGLFIIIVITGMLYNLNTPIIRLFEGYPWKESFIGKWRRDSHTERFKQAKARQKGIRTLLRAMDSNDPDYAAILRYWSASGEALEKTYPDRELLILPTRLGNMIRSFERYPDVQYKMESILLWTRLISKIDKDYAATITDAKTSVDFMVNSSVLSALLALAALVLGLIFPQNTLASSALFVIWLIKIVGLITLAYLFYLGAIPRAGAWGETVKGAFDLYRWELLKQLGYQQSPKTRSGERSLWIKINRQMMYGDHPSVPTLDYEDISAPIQLPAAKCEPSGPELTVSRGVRQPGSGQNLLVVLEIKNQDTVNPAAEVSVTDQVPEGYDYIWESASSPNRAVSVKGTNPYQFTIGDLQPNGSVELEYQAFRRVMNHSLSGG